MNTAMKNLSPPVSDFAIVRKLGAMTPLSVDEVAFLESLHESTSELAPGANFIEEGQDYNAMYVVVEGWAVRYHLTRDGRRQILSFAVPGDILGLHVNFRRNATFSAAALSKLTLSKVDPSRSIEMSRSYPVLSAGLNWCTAREFTILGDQAVRLGRLSAYKALTHLFLELWQRLRLIGMADNDWIEMPLTQTDIADTLGLSLVHTNRQIQRLKRERLITVRRNSLRLNDIDRLIDIAEYDMDHLQAFRL